MKLPVVNKKFWVVSAALALVSIFLAYYLLIYVPSKEEELIARNYRSLKRIGSNIGEVKQMYSQNITQVADSHIGASKGKTNRQAIKDLYHNYPGLKNLNVLIDSAQLKNSDSLRYITFQYSQKYYYNVSVGEFIKRAIINNQFDDFFLIRVTRNHSNKKDKVDAGIAYQTFAHRIELSHIDKFFTEDHGLRTIPLIDITLSGVPYKLLTHRINFTEAEDWILCGALRKDAFHSKSRSVNGWKIAISILIVLVVLLAMPVLKLMIMNAMERLRIINVWFAGFSIIVGTAILFLILLAGNQFFGYVYALDNKLKNLSKSVDKEFTNELHAIYDQLIKAKTFDPTEKGYVGIWGNIEDSSTYHQKRKSEKANANVGSIRVTKKIDKSTFRFFNETLWLDGDGELDFIIATHGIDPQEKLLNLKDRKYFSRVKHDSLWLLPALIESETLDVSKKFALQSIRSWSSGSHEAGFGIPIDKSKAGSSVLAMATRLSSVMDARVPPGYGFCIIDDTGEVWFHTDKKKNTQENYLNETDNNEKLKAAMAGRMATSLEVKYDDTQHRLYIKPIDNLPLYLCTFYDMEYYKTPIILTLTHAFPLVLLMFFIIGIQLFLLFVSTYRPTKLKTLRFYLHWLRPRKIELTVQASIQKETSVVADNKENISVTKDHQSIMKPLEKYMRSIVTLSALFVFLLALLFFKHSPSIAFSFLILPVYIFVFQFLLFERESILKPQQNKKVNGVLIHPFVLLSLFLILLLNILAYPYLTDFYFTMIVQGIFIIVLFIGYQHKANGRYQSEFLINNYQRLYFIMIFLWLAIVSVLPTFSFYKTAYCEESTTWSKFILWQSAQQEYQRHIHLAKELKTFSKDLPAIERFGNYLEATNEFIPVVKWDSGCGSDNPKEQAWYEEVRSRAPLNSLIKSMRPTLMGEASDSAWQWSNYDAETLAIKYHGADGQVYKSNVAKIKFNLMDSQYFILFLLMIFSLAYLIYKATIFAIKNIFGLHIVYDHQLIEKSLRKISVDDLMIKTNSQSSKRVFITGLPYAGKSHLLKSYKPLSTNIQYPDEASADEINFRKDLHKPLRPSLLNANLLVVTHFEHGINDHVENEKKLNILQQVMEANGQIIISSTVPPTAVIDFYDMLLVRMPTPPSEEQKKDCAHYRQAIKMWRNILSDFIVFYQPLGRSEPIHSKSITPFAHSELWHGHYLPQLVGHLQSEYSHTYEEQENFVLRVEELATPYYYAIWNSLSNPEKFLLFDVAKDHFVNPRNLNVIRLLLKKGIIVAADSLQIMNKSFTNFILSVVDEDDEMRMERQQYRKGSWSLLYAVLIVFLVGLITFIGIAQPEIFKHFDLILTALGSALVILTRFGGLFNTAPKVKE